MAMAVPWVFLAFDVRFTSEFEKPLIYYLLCEKVQLWVYRDGVVLTFPSLLKQRRGLSFLLLCCAPGELAQGLLGNPASPFCLLEC